MKPRRKTREKVDFAPFDVRALAGRIRNGMEVVTSGIRRADGTIAPTSVRCRSCGEELTKNDHAGQCLWTALELQEGLDRLRGAIIPDSKTTEPDEYTRLADRLCYLAGLIVETRRLP